MGTALRGLTAIALASMMGCHASSSTVAGAATMTALAAGSSVANRAAGGCIALCTNGTVCNNKTGLCERLPCRGECGANERCEESFIGHKCVPGGGPAEVATPASSSSGAKLPGVAAPPDPSGSSGPPQIVPKAEEKK